jgi:amino acid transporter
MAVDASPRASGSPGQKGLRDGALGLLSSVVIGVASTAPAYSTAAVIGLVVAAIGVHAPGVLVLSFVPILFVAVAFREFNSVDPDCGTVFSWVRRAFGPVTGWLGGWSVIAPCIVVMSSVSQVAAEYTFLLFGADGLAASRVWTTVGGVVFIALMTWICYLGIEVSARLQFALLTFELLAVLVFAIVALVKVYTGHAMATGSTPSLGWLNPVHGSFGDLSDAFLLAVFIYWGWDTSLNLNEETRDGSRTAGRAAVLAPVLLVAVFVLVSIAMLAFAGPAFLTTHSGDVLNAMGRLVLGSTAGKLLVLCVLTSTAASTETTIMPTARIALSMSAHGALPARFARVHRRHQTPGFATITIGVVSAALFVALSVFSTNVLADSASAVGLLIAFYYGLTALACLWYFRATVLASGRNLLLRGILPLLGGLSMLGMFLLSIHSYLPAASSYSSLDGVGGVFIIGAGTLLLGVPLLLVARRTQRAYFASGPMPPAPTEAPDLAETVADPVLQEG